MRIQLILVEWVNISLYYAFGYRALVKADTVYIRELYACNIFRYTDEVYRDDLHNIISRSMLRNIPVNVNTVYIR